MNGNEDIDNTKSANGLCCFEFFNNKQERSHILACCCNCEDFDACADRLVVCEKVPMSRLSGLASTLQDRLRIPWRGGAKQISIDSALPIIILPICAYLAAQSLFSTVTVFSVSAIAFYYAHQIILSHLPKTKFFVVWTVTSVVLLLFILEMNVVPLLEILPEENLVLIGLVLSAIWCAHKTRIKAISNHVTRAGSPEAATEVTCAVCHKRIPPRTYHCHICQACVLKRDHHNVWLDCCIGDNNLLLYIMALLFSFGALTYGAILTLTSVCHPFFFLNAVLLPDDCSDVYHDLEIAMCFVGAVYCLLLSAILLIRLVHQCWTISLGITGQEWRGLPASEKRALGVASLRPHSRGVPRNWAAFLCRALHQN